MQTHRNLLICLLALFGTVFVTSINAAVDSSNDFASTNVYVVPHEQSSKSNVAMKQQYLRSSASEINPITTIPKSSDRDKAIEEDDRELRYSEYDDDFHNSVVEEHCKGFKYKKGDDRLCRITKRYYFLVVFITIGVIIGIVICSCACCKCCIWYPYMCCATEEERSRRNLQTPVYHVTQLTKTTNATNATKPSTAATAYPTVATADPTVATADPTAVAVEMPTPN